MRNQVPKTKRSFGLMLTQRSNRKCLDWESERETIEHAHEGLALNRFCGCPSVPRPADVQTPSADAGRLSEEPLPPGVVVDQAGAALYGLPPALAVQGLHVGFGHHHLGAGEADA